MSVSMEETTADRFSVCMSSLRYGSSNTSEETSGLYQAVPWKLEERIKSGESTHQVPETSSEGEITQPCVEKRPDAS